MPEDPRYFVAVARSGLNRAKLQKISRLTGITLDRLSGGGLPEWVSVEGSLDQSEAERMALLLQEQGISARVFKNQNIAFFRIFLVWVLALNFSTALGLSGVLAGVILFWLAAQSLLVGLFFIYLGHTFWTQLLLSEVRRSWELREKFQAENPDQAGVARVQERDRLLGGGVGLPGELWDRRRELRDELLGLDVSEKMGP